VISDTHAYNISQLLDNNNYTEVDRILELPSSGSGRIYFRISFKDKSKENIIAAYNPETSENIAQYSFTIHFLENGLRVPRIFAKDDSYKYFLLEDLGNTSMLDAIANMNWEEKLKLYKSVLNELIKFQFEGIKGLDLDVAWPVSKFERQNILWDLNYFKYYFVKTHDSSFNEASLESDFQKFSKTLLSTKSEFFLYRDFQARNIMLKENEPWFIDFQGGRQGPLQYDLVSLLYQAKANLSEDFRDLLFNYYISLLQSRSYENIDDFKSNYSNFIWFRIMQVMGAYGYRGILQRKAHFLQSIPYVINIIKVLLNEKNLGPEFPELNSVFSQICELKDYCGISVNDDKLVVSVNSFSYKKGGYPNDISGNGGGFAFDCRSLPNPGRYKELQDYTGRDKVVIDFMKKNSVSKDFINQSYKLIQPSVDNYLERNFKNLQINFGCTGGKHRSVYCAENIASMLEDEYGEKIVVKLLHQQIEKGI